MSKIVPRPAVMVTRTATTFVRSEVVVPVDNVVLVVDNASSSAPLSTYARVKRWRQSHREEYNARMRKRRAKIQEGSG